MSSDAPRRARRTVLEGRYRVDGVLARGGMSTVHHGMDLRLDRPVAIKVMDPALADDPAFVRRFEREARAAARLAHPGIVAVHDQGCDADGTVFLVLELVEGGTLRDVLREHGRLRPAAALTVVEQIVTALGVAHARGLVHRDVKPENVLVPAAGGAVKVADFGLVGALHEGRVHEGTDDGPLLGTVAYLAPEQITDSHVDERTDLYSVGVVLFELLTGTPPHTGPDAAAVAYRHAEADVPPPSSRAPGVPPALDRLVVAATRRSPDRRPPSTAVFLALARDARLDADLPYAPVPRPPMRAAVPPPRPPLTGTRRIDLDDVPADTRRLTDDGDEAGTGTGSADGPAHGDGGHDPVPELLPGRVRSRTADDVDDRIGRLERKRARTRSRRWFAVWLALVTVATVAAGLAGWALGVPG